MVERLFWEQDVAGSNPASQTHTHLGTFLGDSPSLRGDTPMPRKPPTPCPVPACSELTQGGRCVVHAQQDKRIRRERGNAVYGMSAWQRARKAFLYSNPWCVLCGKAANVADHWPYSRKELEARGEPKPDAPKHLRPLCTLCHNRETARLQPGGWAAERQSPVRGADYDRFKSDPNSSL